MIIEFKVKNYKNFEDWLTLNFSQTREYNFNTFCLKDGLINKALIYGQNGSGKSNLGYAILDITSHLTDNYKQISISPFLNLDSIETTCQFSYLFKFDKTIVEYYYTKDSNKRLVIEEIKENGNIVLQYNHITKKVMNKINGLSNLKFENNSSNISIVKFIYNNTFLNNDSSIKQIMEFTQNMKWFRSLRDFKNTRDVNEEEINDYIISNNLIEDLEIFLKHNNVNLKLDTYNNLGKDIIVVKYNNGVAPIYDVVSTGTVSLILFYYLLKQNNKISFLFIDEFDAFYHYELSKELLLSILEKDFQTVITTHNTFLCDNDLLRPDCYFIMKNNKVTPFSNLTKKVIRQGHNLEKMMISKEFDK